MVLCCRYFYTAHAVDEKSNKYKISVYNLDLHDMVWRVGVMSGFSKHPIDQTLQRTTWETRDNFFHMLSQFSETILSEEEKLCRLGDGCFERMLIWKPSVAERFPFFVQRDGEMFCVVADLVNRAVLFLCNRYAIGRFDEVCDFYVFTNEVYEDFSLNYVGPGIDRFCIEKK